MAIYQAAVLLVGVTAALSAQTSIIPAAHVMTPAQLAAFPAGEGREVIARVCSGCHALEAVTQQRLAPAYWTRIVDAMAGTGAQGSDAEFAAITAYLTKAFPVE